MINRLSGSLGPGLLLLALATLGLLAWSRFRSVPASDAADSEAGIGTDPGQTPAGSADGQDRPWVDLERPSQSELRETPAPQQYQHTETATFAMG
ncbi:MAG: hypothetical protein PVI59_10840 [Anaerolineae bacterium]|jgi:hypothetical protein